MNSLPDLPAGQVVGEWTVLGPSRAEKGTRWVPVRCSCGTETEVRAGNLRSGLKGLRNGSTRCRACGYKRHPGVPRSVPGYEPGDRVGNWLVIGSEVTTERRRVPVRCICGIERVVSLHHLRDGVSTGCGCMAGKHRQARTRLYKIWAGMRQRCDNPLNPSYRYYGERGIKVCDEWRTFQPFYEWAQRSGYADDLSIDRIEVEKGYEPDNCRWETDAVQARNKRTNHLRTAFGETKTFTDWVADPRCVVSDSSLRNRLAGGMSMEEALTTPPQNQNARRAA